MDVLQTERRSAARKFLETEEGKKVLEQQLALFAQAIDQGSSSTRHVALHRQAETLAHLQRLEDAAATFTQVVQHWPDDRRARLGLALITAMRQAIEDVAATDQALAEALTLAFAGTRSQPSPLTAHTALTWLQQAGNVAEDEMFRVFNCGVGMVLVVSADKAPAAMALLKREGELVYQIGRIEAALGEPEASIV